MRQRGDSDLIELLNKVRTASLEESDENVLKSQFISENDSNYPVDALHIFAENKPCQEHNEKMLCSNQNSLYSISAIDDLPKNVSKDVIEKVLNRNQSQTGGLSRMLEIKVNARVMLTVNIDIADRLINGQIGTVKHISCDLNNNIHKIYIKFDDANAGLKKIDTDLLANQNKWVPIEKAEANIMIRVNKDSSPVIKRTQFPLMLAWACTVHKVQGLSLDKAVVSFRLVKQRCFNNGQMYVALSRVTSLSGLCLIGEYKSSAIKADPRASNEYERMRRECVVQPLHNSELSDATLTVTLLNTRSFHRHAIDISHDQDLLNTDVLCLTETQLSPHQNTSNISEILNDFCFLHNKCNDKFQSISFCYKSHIETDNYNFSSGLSVIDFKKISFSQDSIRVLVVYRKNNTCLSAFYRRITDVLQSDTIHVVLGDFNMNAQDHDQIDTLLQIFQNYQQLVKDPTHLGGATLDHVYIRKNYLETFNVDYFVKSIYFSDHDAVQFKLFAKT